MAYVAMARKWRPQSFDDMVGQEHIAQTLKNAIEGGRLHHAFLFTGTRGVGKTTSARILARTLNCTGGDPLHPCGKCESCKDIAGGNPMDIYEIDAASNTGVDNIRDVIDRVQYPPVIGKYKIFIIDEVHMLSPGAFNALLKTLEEPPPHVIFIFATTEVNKLLPTILSRVQRFDFKRLTINQIASRLRYICEQEHINASDETLNIFAEKADGSMRDGLTFFDQAYAFTGSEMDADSVRSVLGIPPTELFFELIQAIENHDLKGCFQMVDKAVNRGIEFAPLLDGFGKFLRNLIYSRLDAFTPDELNISAELYEKFKETAKGLSNGDLLRISKMLIDLQAQIRYSTNPRLLVETTFARMAWLDRLTDLRRALAAINDPKSAADEATKKKVGKILEVLPQEEESVSNETFPESPAPYTRYEITNAWPSISASLANCGDLQFSAAVNGSVLESGDQKLTPFPLFLTYVCENEQSVPWGYQQIQEQPEYLARLKTILQDKLQTQVDLRLRLRTFTNEELIARANAQKNPFERDMDKDELLRKMVEIFGGQYLNSKQLNKQVDLPTSESCEEVTDN
ncbi:DNA polymerase-3 subunit gamma/tau [Fibrobacter sp. UWR3]|uniref:DNA polymerase III subunit gamma/tau n=1 Tax=Fibrobacter sp. UWR3 TaxID=1896217 RepID=UPI0009229F2A|nr:DNA polymerase III subunit gamma/tau [Fibrobacter sp. UWR3]SHM65339.1 DNA polymerase-3 subunit gamma/tau [Fibrobacter sp. UWR3]